MMRVELKRLGILKGCDVAMAEVEDVNGHVVLHGAEEFHSEAPSACLFLDVQVRLSLSWSRSVLIAG